MPRFCTNVKGNPNPCLFEYIYFSRIDSIIDGISVYDARYNLGMLIGEKIKKMNISNIDVIIPVPESSLIFALGLQNCLNIKLHYGFVKNNYIDRTFIMKGNDIINKSIRLKINSVQNIFANRNVLIIDDSIVRGNTSKHIVHLAKKAGANDVHFASGSPPVLYPNKYGIYLPDKKDLIANNRSSKNIADIIGATNVIYNDLYDTINCLKKMNTSIHGFEISMFNNQHLY
jgi:amidophosphoribosyltransferase